MNPSTGSTIAGTFSLPRGDAVATCDHSDVERKQERARDGTVRALAGDMASLLRALAFRDLGGGLTCVIGFGSAAWDRLFGNPRPIGLHAFREIKVRASRGVDPRRSSVPHPRDEPGSLLRARDADHLEARRRSCGRGRSPRLQDYDQRDLLGFVDGTEGPSDQRAIDAAIIGEEDPSFAGGSYCIVQEYLHDLEAWNDVRIAQITAPFRRKWHLRRRCLRPGRSLAEQVVFESEGVSPQ